MFKNKIIIGLTGLSGSGKDAVADYLEEKGFEYTSLSDRIREECAWRKLETHRDNLIKVGNEIREKFGSDELAKRSWEKIKNSASNKFVIVSLRHPDEVNFLKKQAGMQLIAVEAPIDVRYQRNASRGRAEDFVTLEKFKEQEERERSGSINQQQLDKVIAMADFKFDNSGTLKDLEKQAGEVLEKINSSFV